MAKLLDDTEAFKTELGRFHNQAGGLFSLYVVRLDRPTLTDLAAADDDDRVARAFVKALCRQTESLSHGVRKACGSCSYVFTRTFDGLILMLPPIGDAALFSGLCANCAALDDRTVVTRFMPTLRLLLPQAEEIDAARMAPGGRA